MSTHRAAFMIALLLLLAWVIGLTAIEIMMDEDEIETLSTQSNAQGRGFDYSGATGR